MERFRCLLILLIAAACCGTLLGQPATRGHHAGRDGGAAAALGFCGSDALLGERDAATAQREAAVNRLLYALLDRRNRGEQMPMGTAGDQTYTIPVVVHIVHDGGGENIPDAQVIAGLQQMNDAYANIGVYDPASGVSVGIQFCLAKQDPGGNPTTGITRARSSLTEMTMETDDIPLKNLERWAPEHYLNIWLVREINSASVGSGVAGYAYFPSSHGGPEDGIVGEARWFGSSTDNSKIFVHEAGHYLGLYHTFQGGCANNDCLADGDMICDTPPDGTTLGIPCGSPFNSCTTDADDHSVNNPFRPVTLGGLGDQGDLYSDYMDYGHLECYSVFTQGQKDRMRAVITTIRQSLLESKGCLSPCTRPVTAIFTASAQSVISGTTVTFTNASSGAGTYEWRVNGVVIATTTNASYTFTAQGRYVVVLRAFNGNPGCNDEDSVIIDVTCPARAQFIADRRSIQPGESVTFTNTSTGATTYEWLLDGTPVGTTKDLWRLFAGAGGYRVALVACNGICCDTSLAVLVRVGACDVSKRWGIWYFGDNAGIDFNSGQPVVLTDGALVSHEGVATICDADGNLLFYSNGVTVWNRRHAAMMNGTGLGGSKLAAQSATIVPMPGSDSLYYLFTVTDWWQRPTGLRYSVIDMSLDGGLGGITAVKNIHLRDSVSEELAAVMHANCRDVWIVTHEMDNDRFLAYRLTQSGLVADPVISVVGSVTGNSNNRYGYLKFQPGGRRLCSALGGHTSAPTVELFDFDNATGVVSNQIVLAGNGLLSSTYSSEFSIDGRYLYAGNLVSGTVYQFDLAAGDGAAIRASKRQVGAVQAREMGCFQMGPDGRIYITGTGAKFLSVINYPNLGGAACGFVENALDLKGRTGEIGLPGVVAASTGSVRIDGPRGICAGDSLQTYHLRVSSCAGGARAWRITGNAEIVASSDTAATVHIKGSGEVRLFVEAVGICGLLTDSLGVSAGTTPHIDLGGDTALCAGTSVLLDAGSGFISYRWHDGTAAQTCTARGPGVYWVEVTTAEGCIARDTILVFPDDANISVNLGPDTSMCVTGILTLDAGAGALRYRWQDGSTDRRYTAFRPGKYWVEVVGRCGSAADTIVIGESAPAIDLGRDTALCSGESLLLDAGPGFIGYQWHDGTRAQTNAARGPGTYWVEVSTADGCTARDTIQVALDDASIAVNLGPDTSMCTGGTLTLDAGAGALRYRWQDGSTDRRYTALQPGKYWVEVVGRCGSAADTIVIGGAAPAIDLGHDTSFCGPVDVLLDAGPGFSEYTWQDGSVGRTFHATAPGLYTVHAHAGECESVASIRIESGLAVTNAALLAGTPAAASAPGDVVTIPLLLMLTQVRDPLVGLPYRVRVRFNRTLLLPAGDTPAGTIQDSERIITVTGSIGRSDTLAVLQFLVLLGDAERTELAVDSFRIDGTCSDDVALEGRTVGVLVCRSGGARLIVGATAAALTVRGGNPADKVVTIDYSVMEQGATRLTLVNVLGERARVLADGARTLGKHTLVLDASQLPPGPYFLLLETPTEVMMEKFMVWR